GSQARGRIEAALRDAGTTATTAGTEDVEQDTRDSDPTDGTDGSSHPVARPATPAPPPSFVPSAPPVVSAAPNHPTTPFTSIHDFVTRTRLDRRALRALAEAGAFDAFVPDEPPARRRRVALWRVLEAARMPAGPLALFPESRVPPHLPGFRPPELTEADYRLTGLSLNGHPMRHLRALLAPNGVRSAREILALRDGEAVAHAGLVICRQRPGTAKGFVFLTLEDETGTINVVITPQRFERQALLISRTPLLLVRGVLQVESGVYNIRAKSFAPLKAGAGEEAARSHDFR
ncbi:MAG: hypothetical protein K1X31_07280, partial [Gemmatimonadaceae bacterium]|nr:hypothetical protein [Gemmatimonadaceae bacterium]